MKKFLVLAMLCLLGGCGRRAAVEAPGALDEPDKVLYTTALNALERDRFIEARIAFQTLIGTYPDSEFLPQAKYGLGESFYRERTTSALNQSETEFKDYITFFPITDLADDAQLKVAMTHLLQMEKPDRDSTQARLAEIELKNMISDYPDSPLLEEAKQKLRDVQEVLATGVERIGDHYFRRQSYAAATDRYMEILEKYPDYSTIDKTIYSLAESLRRNNNEPESGIYYARVVSDHPLSEYAADSRRRLAELNMPIPEANPVAIARAQQRPEGKGIFGKMIGVFGRRPDVDTDTGAASISADPNAPAGDGNGEFTIDPRVVDPEKK